MPGFDSIAPERYRWACWLIALLTTQMAYAGPSVRFVEDDAAPGGDGLTWITAYRHLQDALFEAAADLTVTEVRVAGGTYQPDVDESGNVTALDRLATFSMRSNLALRGGYRGLAGGGDADDRDFVAFETILTGDLAGNDGPDFAGHDENSFHIVTSSNTGPTAMLDGFTITGGNANGGFLERPKGGGLLNVLGSPSITQCVFRQNQAEEGGGLYSSNGSPTLSNCEFSGNQAVEVESLFVRGGGMSVETGTVHLVDCTFSQNQSASNFSTGGGLAFSFVTEAHLERCTFIDNHCGASGGGLFVASSSSITLTQCLFVNNTASTGGGALIAGIDVWLVGCRFRSCTAQQGGGLWVFGAFLVGCEFDNNSVSSEFSPTLAAGGGAIVGGQSVVVGCRFTNNSAGNRGGGMLADAGEPIIITNSVFNANSAGARGGGMLLESSTALVANCTFTGNLGTNGKAVGVDTGIDGVSVANCIFRDGGDEIFIGSLPPSQLALTYSNVQGGWPGAGNIDADPLFADPLGLDGVAGTLDDDFRLRPGSPCIDAGDNSQVPSDAADLDDDDDVVEPTPFDFDGKPRFVDDLSTPDIGAGGPPLVDMGAFEFNGDCNDNGIPDVEDIANQTSQDCNTNLIPDECEADCNTDGTPDACETVVAEQDCDRDGVCNGEQIASCTHR